MRKTTSLPKLEAALAPPLSCTRTCLSGKPGSHFVVPCRGGFGVDILFQQERLAAAIDLAEMLEAMPGLVLLGLANLTPEHGDATQRQQRSPPIRLGQDLGLRRVGDQQQAVNNAARLVLPDMLLPR